MKIQLSQNEIKDAIRKYVGTDLGISLTGKTLDVEFTATRGAQGVIADLNIELIKHDSPVGPVARNGGLALTNPVIVKGEPDLPKTVAVDTPAEVALAGAEASMETVAAAANEPVTEKQPEPAVEEEAKPADTAPAASTTSIFG